MGRPASLVSARCSADVAVVFAFLVVMLEDAVGGEDDAVAGLERLPAFFERQPAALADDRAALVEPREGAVRADQSGGGCPALL